MAFSPKFVPFDQAHCNGYDDHLCKLCRFVAFFGIGLIIVYGLFAMYVIYKLAKEGWSAINSMKNDSYIFRTLYATSIFSIFDLHKSSDLWSASNEKVSLGCGHVVDRVYLNENTLTLVKCVECQHHQEVMSSEPKTKLSNGSSLIGSAGNAASHNPLHVPQSSNPPSTKPPRFQDK